MADRVIDSAVFHGWTSAQDLAPYLPDGWRDLLTESRVDISGTALYRRLLRDDVTPPADVETLRADLDGTNRERVVLSYDAGLRATTNQNHFVGDAIATAANRWTEEEWLSRDDRLYGLVVAACAVPDLAAAEIRRSGENPRMVGVLMGSAGLGVPLGHPAYHCVYAAASELGLPLVMHAGVDATENAVAPAIAGGLPSTAGEYHALAWHTQMAHVTSLIMQGVFDVFPKLRVMLTGAGAVWLPGHLWRVNNRFGITRGDGRWIQRRPLDYLDRFMLSTHGLERPPRSEQLRQALSVMPDVEQRLMYASGFPSAGWTEAEGVVEALPVAWHRGVFHDNAVGFFRWPEAVATAGSPGSRSASSDER